MQIVMGILFGVVLAEAVNMLIMLMTDSGIFTRKKFGEYPITNKRPKYDSIFEQMRHEKKYKNLKDHLDPKMKPYLEDPEF